MKQLKITLFIALLFLSNNINLFGQEYQSISSARTSFFENKYNYIRCIRIDSVKYETDSILYPYTIIQNIEYDCFSPYIASWIGEKIIIKGNGENLFLNNNNDTITLKTKAELNEKWIAFQVQDIIIEAEIIKHDTLHFLGLIDSVKTIGFTAYNEKMNLLDNKINNIQVAISQNYGFVKTANFYAFPNLSLYKEVIEEYKIVGLSNPEVGIKNLTWFDVHDFNIGDELHILTEDWDGPGGYRNTDKVIYKYIDRITYPDSLIFQCARKRELKIKNNDFELSQFYNDTIRTVIEKNSLFDKLPEEPIISNGEVYSFYMGKEKSLLIKSDPVYEIFDQQTDSCWRMLLADGCLSMYTYIEGLGGPYHSCTDMSEVMGYSRNLTYYKKGEITWGTPLEITSNTIELKNENQINIYPNPVKDGNIHILLNQETYSEYTFELIDINGKIVKLEKLDSNQSVIELSDFKKGIYLYKISAGQIILKTDKLIIE